MSQATRQLGRLPHPQPGEENAEQGANEDLNRGVPEQFAKMGFADGMPLEQLVDDLIQNASLNPGGTPDTGGVVHNDHCQNQRDRK